MPNSGRLPNSRIVSRSLPTPACERTRKAMEPIAIPATARFLSPTGAANRLTATPWTKINVQPIKTNIQARRSGEKEKRSTAKKVSVNSMPLKEIMYQKYDKQVRRMAGFPIFPSWRNDGRSLSVVLCSKLNVSLKENATSPQLSKASAKLAKAGTENGFRPNAASLEFPSVRSCMEPNPPMAGPKMKPNPKAIPTTAMPFARLSRGVTSAMAAVATDKLPLAIPPITLDRSSIQNWPANTHSR